jgi:DNA-binding YbaB/EbfC family protein
MDFSKMMKEAQRLQKQLTEAQKRLAEMEIEGISGGGMVSVTLMGDGKMRRLHIDESLLSEKDMLEDLIIAAYNDAQQKLEEKRTELMGVNLPAGMPF